MTSRNLFFKLMREDLKSRLWTIALISLGGFFMYPVTAAFLAGEMNNALNYEQALNRYTAAMVEWLSFENGGTVFMMMAAALVCGFSGFIYLNSKKKVDFYHSIPVRREKLFLVNYMDGILILAVPFAVNLMAATVIAMGNGVEGSLLWPKVLTGFGLHMVYFILMYTVVVLAAMLTGNLVIGFLGSLVLAFYFPTVATLFRGYADCFFNTYLCKEKGLSEIVVRMSPVIQYILRFQDYKEGKPLAASILITLAVSAILAGVCCILYKKRPSEAAGKALAFPVSRPIIRILITLASALGFSLFFWSIRKSNGWALFGIICGGLISHCVIEIIYHFDFKKLFSNRWQLVGCILASTAIFFVFRYDLTGYDRYLPSAGQVREAAFYDRNFSDWVSYGKTEYDKNNIGYEYRWSYDSEIDVLETMALTDIDSVLAIAAEGIAQTQQLIREQEEMGEVIYEGETSRASSENQVFDRETSVCVRYTLNSGRKVYRYYRMNLAPVREQVEIVYQNPEYQTAVYPLMRRTSAQVSSVRYRENDEEVILNHLTEAEKKELLETYQQEFGGITLDQMEKEYPVGLIRFVLPIDDEAMSWWKEQMKKEPESYRVYRYENEFARRDFYPIYPSFTKTIDLLKQYDVIVGSYQNNLEPDSMVAWIRREDGREDETFYIHDQELMKEIMGTAVRSAISYYNPMYEFDDIYVEVTYREGEEENYSSESLYFPKGKVPSVLLREFENMRADKQ